jgi:hypothetical protein
MTAAVAWCVCVQSHETGPELFVEVLGTLATAADAACGSSSSSSNAEGTDAAAAGAGGSGSDGLAPWQLMHGVTLQDVLAFLVGCFQQGAASGLSEYTHVWAS